MLRVTRDLDLAKSGLLRRTRGWWPTVASFPGNGQLRPERQEIDRLHRVLPRSGRSVTS